MIRLGKGKNQERTFASYRPNHPFSPSLPSSRALIFYHKSSAKKRSVIYRMPLVHSAFFKSYFGLSEKSITKMLRYVNGGKQYQSHDLTVDVGPGHVYSETGQLRFRAWTNKGKKIRLKSFTTNVKQYFRFNTMQCNKM